MGWYPNFNGMLNRFVVQHLSRQDGKFLSKQDTKRFILCSGVLLLSGILFWAMLGVF